MERKFNPSSAWRNSRYSDFKNTVPAAARRRPRTSNRNPIRTHWPVGGWRAPCVARSQYTKTSLSYPRRLQFAPPPVCNTSTTLDSLTLQTARRERQPHTAERIGWRGSAVTDEIQWAESPFFEIPILSFEGRVGNR